MTAPQTLVQAAIARLAARLGSSAVDLAANLALLAQDAPEKVRQELQLFWEEVQQEAERLERGADQPADGGGPEARPAPVDLQDQIDGLRAQVARLSRGLERRP
jgi:hypothetical protein